MKFIYIFVLFFVNSIKSDDDSDKFWILIDSVSFLPCNGPPNQFNLTKDDVSIKDKNGQSVQYMEAPNDYDLEFKNIKVFKPLKNLVGQMNVMLQVPVISGGFITLAFPYQVLPQKTILEGSQCDNESGVYVDPKDRKEYCRYCELCDSATHAENKLASDKLGHNFLPETGQSEDEPKFGKFCKQINQTNYDLKRKISVPGQKQMKQQVNDRVKGSVEGVVQQKLAPGKGALVVTLQLDSYDKSVNPSKQWYLNLKNCSCCVKDDLGDSTCHQTFIERVSGKNPSTCLKCNNQYVKTCTNGNGERVGCYVVKYNFRVTNDSKVAEKFKQSLEKKKQGQQVSGSIATDTDAGSGGAKADANAQVAAGQQNNQSASQATSRATQPPSQAPQTQSQAKPCDTCDAVACSSQLTVPAYKGYCQTAMSQQGTSGRRFCCRYCPKVCIST